MLLSDMMQFTGKCKIQRKDANNTLLYDSGWLTNRETNYFAQSVAKWLVGINNTGYNPVISPQYIELGTGSGTPAPTDTNIFAPVANTLIQCSLTDNPSANVAEYIAQYFGTTSNQGVYTEAGLFDVNNNLWAHLMASITITQGETTTVTWQVTVTV